MAWALSTSPEIIANWIANGNKWTVPIGGGLSKVVRLGEQPIKFGLAAYYNSADRPTKTLGNSRDADVYLLRETGETSSEVGAVDHHFAMDKARTATMT